MTTIPVELRELLERVADHLEWDGSEPMTTIQYAYKCDGLAAELRALLAEQPKAGAGQEVPECFALVPIERSYDMRVAAILHYNTAKKEGKDHDDALDAAWRATLAKAHAPDGSQPLARHDQGDEVRRLLGALCRVRTELDTDDNLRTVRIIAIIDAALTANEVRTIVANTAWSSPGVRRNACDKLSSVFKAALQDGVISRNPVSSVARPKVAKKLVDPLSRAEAELIIQHLYEKLSGLTRVYACYFEFAFFTGMRPGEMMALRWEEIDFQGRSAHVCRVQVDGVIHDRVKTKNNRHVLLNDRALHALNEAKPLTMARSGFVFAPAVQDERSDWIRTDTTPRKYFSLALRALGIRTRRQYDTRHTYATMCLMAGMNPAFIANQLGHSVQMLLSTYAKWLNSTSDWAELQKLEKQEIGTELVQAKQ